MKRLPFSGISRFVTTMALAATSLTATVCSADDAPAETESLGNPPSAIATTTTAATPPAHHEHHDTRSASAPAAAATPAPVLTAATTTIASAPTPTPAASAPAATPLQLRETAPHALELAPEPAANSLWKLGAILALLGAGAYALKKHNEKNKPAETVRSLKVLKKLSIGVRTELMVVDVDGQRLLLGVTPSSIQTLAALPDPEPMEMPEPERESTSRISPTVRPAPEMGERSLQIGERLAALVEKSRISETGYPEADSRPDLRVTARPQRRISKKPGPATEPPEGQARGLSKIGRI
jgi:flagellar protein FliO/FliZ